jgi:Uncharacterised nucleotidyltransferase
MNAESTSLSNSRRPSALRNQKVTCRVFDEPLSPELELVLCGASPVFDDAARQRVEGLLHRDLDGEILSELALRHGLSALLYTRLNSLVSRPRHESLLKLKSDAVVLTQRALILTTEMKRLVPRLEANGIETLVFKGPALARTIYRNVVLRAFTDLDIMVRPTKVAQAWALLAREGYTLAYNLLPAHLPVLMASGNHLPLYGSPNNELIELHWTFFAKSRATPFDTEGAWARREPLHFDETTIMTLAPHDLVHFLCLHGTKHAWSRLSWITDLAWFMFQYPTFDWDALVDHAAQLGTRRMTLVGLALLDALFSIPLSEPVTRQIQDDSDVLPLARWMWQRLLRGMQNLPTGLELAQLVLRSRERRRDRACDFYHHVMALRPSNLEDAPHYATLFHTYALHRLWYLFHKYSRVRM